MVDDRQHIAVAFPAASDLHTMIRARMGRCKGLALLAQHLCHQRKNRAVPVFGHILRHLAYERAGADEHAGIGLHLPAKKRQQRRFTCAVAAHKAEPVANFNGEISRIQ